MADLTFFSNTSSLPEDGNVGILHSRPFQRAVGVSEPWFVIDLGGIVSQLVEGDDGQRLMRGGDGTCYAYYGENAGDISPRTPKVAGTQRQRPLAKGEKPLSAPAKESEGSSGTLPAAGNGKGKGTAAAKPGAPPRGRRGPALKACQVQAGGSKGGLAAIAKGKGTMGVIEGARAATENNTSAAGKTDTTKKANATTIERNGKILRRIVVAF
ncbi:hypothetical protein GGTG_06124 [Gaeumannomyces tritici R3-111a-1]|uniref:Uncharacterized protein n=1 Tax=Gaeumannomyces tritici (strain R3-111a-1) TaxID=644352 RepID=J3NXW9_GAET3|nr:hypothetical protein GGTG_06124 [Gaeumannomyces tritici R3-111a-1]EJT76202.1 hypothetical protein GGTG_06124 [Gaeumannomyces tritici R3-111a-1]